MGQSKRDPQWRLNAADCIALPLRLPCCWGKQFLSLCPLLAAGGAGARNSQAEQAWPWECDSQAADQLHQVPKR